MRRVVNASRLIHLSRLSLLELLREPGQSVDVAVPSIVFDEVMRGASYDPTAVLVEVATHDWLTIVPAPPPHPNINQAKIDAGEIAVLSIALITPGSSVVLDDRAARTEADRKQDERLERGNRLAEQVEKLIAEKKAAEAVALVDRAIQKKPGERVWYGQMKLQALVADPKLADKALEYGIELAAAAAARANHDMPTHRVLLHIASTLASPSSDAPPDR